ncbi:hypothetical protein T11_16163 [Trichinella zimbabwensis]|uniref:Uncharacterized protein n=1 Tax=Trichinella zimbabwensis TaxID=268475 RepID=A0A0V1HUP9_9BILA|nr:hypothetical protein T11_16163 [Trichinella zimbabwensis]
MRIRDPYKYKQAYRIDGSGLLKSIFSRSKGIVALISFPESPLKNLDFSSAQTRQEMVIL